MYFSDNLLFYTLAKKSNDNSTLIQTTHNNTKIHNEDIPFVAVCSAPICFVIVLTLFVFSLLKLSKINQNEFRIFTISLFQQYPCKKCLFFHKNNYLKCAVRPDHVLTKQAFNCSDYQSK